MYFQNFIFRFRRRKLFVISIFLFCIFVVNYFSKYKFIAIEIESQFLINTETCSISKTEIMPAWLRNKWHTENIPDCDYESILADLNDETQILNLRPEYATTNCCIQEVVPVPKNDNSYRLSYCEKFMNNTSVQDKEIIVTQCGSKLNFEANLLKTENVQKKLNYWKKHKGVKPYSVLLIGIDTFSRSLAYRSLPKTMEFIKSEMNFVDFKGYHSVAVGTLHNFMGFLAGKTLAEIRKTCAHNWNEPFDSCPLIWRNFSESNYVTMYVEDGDQTFNFAKKPGFKTRPTDYYIHSLFPALKHLRRKISAPKLGRKYLDLTHGACTSSETVPQFLLRYTERFIKKFENVPTFSFTWFAEPFHGRTNAFRNFDDDMLKFFKFLKLSSSIMQNTLIVFVSDHGDRNSRGTIDGFLERSLPPLFIRLPDRLLKDFPRDNFTEGIHLNSERLTSPYDIHHTFLHLLSLSGVLKNSYFEPRLPDRTSLILPVPLNRTCEAIHVFKTNCACNVSIQVNTLSNPFILENIRKQIGRKLNSIVRDSEYKQVCTAWDLDESTWLHQAQILKNASSQLEVLIQFEAESDNRKGMAEFETMIRVNYDPAEWSDYGKTEMIGNFTRLSLYGNQSACVGGKTDFDKEMKGLCYCKPDLKKRKSK